MRKFSFAIWCVAVFTASYLVLSSLDMVPLELSEANYRMTQKVKSSFFSPSVEISVAAVAGAEAPEVRDSVKEQILPDHIFINKIGVDAKVLNPETRDTAVLDRALLEGVVRYPGSGGFDDNSNMFLFGHSTGYRIVQNQAFKSFNRLEELQIGDVVSITSGNTEYRYKVVSVSRVNKNEELVEFTSGKKMLTLSTCDSFGEKSDRFVVRAEFVQGLPRSEF